MIVLGKVLKSECDELRTIYQRKRALQELILTLSSEPENNESDQFYEKLIKDLMTTGQKMSDWWIKTAYHYGWQYTEQDSWRINFDTCEVFLSDSKIDLN